MKTVVTLENDVGEVTITDDNGDVLYSVAFDTPSGTYTPYSSTKGWLVFPTLEDAKVVADMFRTAAALATVVGVELSLHAIPLSSAKKAVGQPRSTEWITLYATMPFASPPSTPASLPDTVGHTRGTPETLSDSTLTGE